MPAQTPELEVLVHKLESLLDLVAAGQQVAETELVRTAEQIYAYVRIHAGNPLSSAQARALVELSTAPSHPSLDRLRWRAEGALDMYSRLTSSVVQPTAEARVEAVAAPPSGPVTVPTPHPAKSQEQLAPSGDTDTDRIAEEADVVMLPRLDDFPDLPDDF